MFPFFCPFPLVVFSAFWSVIPVLFWSVAVVVHLMVVVVVVVVVVLVAAAVVVVTGCGGGVAISVLSEIMSAVLFCVVQNLVQFSFERVSNVFWTAYAFWSADFLCWRKYLESSRNKLNLITTLRVSFSSFYLHDCLSLYLSMAFSEFSQNAKLPVVTCLLLAVCSAVFW